MQLSVTLTLGGSRVRGSVDVLFGYGGYGGDARLVVTPRLTDRGRRHGFEVSAGTFYYFPRVGIAYRFVPYRPNIRRLRRR